MRLIEIKDSSLKENGIPFSRSTIYTWHSQGKFPQIFVKIGTRLFINPVEWEKVVKEAIEESQARAKRVKKALSRSYY